MSDLYFNDKRFVGYSKISDVFFFSASGNNVVHGARKD